MCVENFKELIYLIQDKAKNLFRQRLRALNELVYAEFEILIEAAKTIRKQRAIIKMEKKRKIRRMNFYDIFRFSNQYFICCYDKEMKSLGGIGADTESEGD